MRRALIIGVNDYPGCPLAGCENDATRIEKLLSRHYDNKPNFECRTHLSSKERITRDFLRGSLRKLFADPADAALLYFAGHGAATDRGGVLVTVDFSKDDEGIPMGEVVRFARDGSKHIREIFIVIDCCHSGYTGKSWIAPEVDVLPQGVSILTASSPSQPAAEKSGAGVFTSLVCDALEGGAADVLGNVTAARIYAYLDQTLGAWDQRPHFKANLSKLEALRVCEPAVAIDTLREIRKIFSVPDKVLPLFPAYEPTLEPKNEEKERVFSTLQKYRAARLLVPIDEEHLYYAAKNSKSCRLTPLGRFYWNLVDLKKI
jgi:Caspase domain